MDNEFTADRSGLLHALSLLTDLRQNGDVVFALPDVLPEVGIGAKATLDVLAPSVLGGACRLDAPTAFAHMDPPTPWLTWAMALWNASLNQNLLHPATAPVARHIEEKVIAWLAPFFGMQGGHMTPGATTANLTALWSARECAGVEEVVTSDNAHLSIAKAAHLLGLRYRSLPSSPLGALLPEGLPDDLGRSALVLTAGTTSTGALDPLALAGRAAWTHVDAAWAGPLRLSPHYADKLAGIERADSVAVSAHKWLFQPKESALVIFRDVEKAHAAISFGGAYLAAPNIGLLGSHGAVAIPLLATILAWGREGLARQIEHCMGLAEKFAAFIKGDPRLELLGEPETGIVVWRPRDAASADLLHSLLPPGSTSLTTLSGKRWMRNVAANPNADVEAFAKEIRRAIAGFDPTIPC
jgi:L-2,4-diaminobutyrate decarboxylase